MKNKVANHFRNRHDPALFSILCNYIPKISFIFLYVGYIYNKVVKERGVHP